MSSPKSVTQWIEDLKQGDEEAAARLWQRYFEQMVRAARKKLGARQLGVVDEEDVALSAFDSLCRGAAKGNFARLTDRYDLWPLLLTIVAQKSIDHIRRENRQRRGGGQTVLRDAELAEMDAVRMMNQVQSQNPTAETLALLEEQYVRLVSQLRDDTLRDIANWKMEGHTNEQIASFLGISVHAVGRKLRLIRLAWSKELDAATKL